VELIVDERDEVIEDFGVALAPALQELGYFTVGIIHGPETFGSG
jgi:hypothetical protein